MLASAAERDVICTRGPRVAFSEIELKRIEQEVGGLCKRRSPTHLKDELVWSTGSRDTMSRCSNVAQLGAGAADKLRLPSQSSNSSEPPGRGAFTGCVVTSSGTAMR